MAEKLDDDGRKKDERDVQASPRRPRRAPPFSLAGARTRVRRPAEAGTRLARRDLHRCRVKVFSPDPNPENPHENPNLDTAAGGGGWLQRCLLAAISRS